MSREAYAVIGLGVLAAVLLASDSLLLWAQFAEVEFGVDWRVMAPSMGAPILCLVATLVAARSYGMRSVAAGGIIAIGLLAVWGSAWRFAFPLGWVSWLSLAGGVMALAAGIALLYVRTAAPPERLVASSESART
jgi:hypothetical protein